MERTTLIRAAATNLLLTLSAYGTVLATPAPIPYHSVPLTENTGEFRGAVGPEAEIFTAFRRIINIPGAIWLQLRFGDHNLGTESYVTITSLKDGEQQRLNAEGLRHWQNLTGVFNGDTLEVELHVAPTEDGIYLRIEEVNVGDDINSRPATGEPTEEPTRGGPTFICGAADDRVPSNDRGVGRLWPAGCTAWIASNGAYLTAGHCTGNTQVHFNVPQSQANGNVVAPPIADQYPMVAGSWVSRSNGRPDDWAVFDLGPNPNNGDRRAVHAQGDFFRMSRDDTPQTIRITGYGIDGPPPCFGRSNHPPNCTNPNPPLNAQNQTQQTAAGPSLGESGTGVPVEWTYRTDMQRGNSGSPMVVDGARLTVGINNWEDWQGGDCENGGTSFENDDLETALRNFSGVGANVRHLDNGHPTPQVDQDGTVFRPFDTLAEAVNSVPAGGVISIVTGYYGGAMTISKPMELRAPVGPVTLTGAP